MSSKQEEEHKKTLVLNEPNPTVGDVDYYNRHSAKHVQVRATFGSEVLLETKSISYWKHKNYRDKCAKHIDNVNKVKS